MERKILVALHNVDVPLLNEQISALSNVIAVNGDWKMRPVDKDLLEGLLNMMEVVYDDILMEDAEATHRSNNTKPSPGPWRVSNAKQRDRMLIEHGDGETVSPIIAEVLYDEGRLPQHYNASLIAASPNMFNGIRLAASMVSKIMDDLEPATPMWTRLQKVLFRLYDSLPLAPGKAGAEWRLA